MRLAVLTTTMGRLATLQSTAHALLRELGPRDWWVVVDWSCPDRSGDWLEAIRDPRLVVVRRAGERWFHKTAAIGLALERARELGPTHVCQLDADTGPGAGLRRELARLLEPGCFVLAALRPGEAPQRGDSLTGLLALELAEVLRLEPWRPEFRGYGGEDYFARLACLIGGLRPRELARSYCAPIEHSDRARGAHQKDRPQQSWSRNMALMRRLVLELTGASLRELPGAARMLNCAGSSLK